MERHVSEDVPSWAHFLFMHFIQAFGRALAECMIGNALFFHAREAVSTAVGSAVMWRGNVQKAILILAAILAAFLSVGGVSEDAEIRGRVVKVADGDTITILESVGSRVPVLQSLGEGGPRDRASPAATQHKIRLCGIDAPESHQAFGQKSKQHLSSLARGKRDVTLKRVLMRGRNAGSVVSNANYFKTKSILKSFQRRNNI